MKILITGAAGFIGSKLACQLAHDGHEVIAIDNINTYYDPNLKCQRLKHFLGIEIDPTWSLSTAIPETGNESQEVTYPEVPWGQVLLSSTLPSLKFIRADITDLEALQKIFKDERPDKVMNLAAQAGVRYSIKNPYTYIENNVMGFTNLLECCRQFDVKHLVYASSSSVYGENKKTPFAETDNVDNAISVYAATKKCNELLAHVYNKLYGLSTTGLRFFTVYGPWGRPDMAPMLFAKDILAGKPIKVFNNGNLSRDFTYIDDIVNGVVKVLTQETDANACAVFNIGLGHPMPLMDFIHILEQALDTQAKMEMLPMQPGDVHTTYADISRLKHAYNYQPSTPLAIGISEFAKWYRSTYPTNL